MSDEAVVVILIIAYYNLMALSLLYGERLIRLIPRPLRELLTKMFLKLAAIFNILFERIEGIHLKWKTKL